MTDSRPPLLITDDDDLAEEVLRLAAAAGCEPRRIRKPRGAEEPWHEAPLVLLDPTTLAEFERLVPASRAGFALVCTDPPGDFWRLAFESGARHAIDLPRQENRLIELFGETMGEVASRTGRVLAVLGGCGGAGASVLACATALTAARRDGGCSLLDCDEQGGGLDLALGIERTAGLRWSDLKVGEGRLAQAALRDALPGRNVGRGRLTLLTWGRCDSTGPSAAMNPQSINAVIGAARRAGETVVCDLPRMPNDAATTALRQADLGVVVIPAEVRACAAARRLLSNLPATSAPLHAVVRGPAPAGLDVRDVERAVGLRAITALRSQARLPAAMDRSGLRPVNVSRNGPLGRAAHRVLTVLNEHAASPAMGLPASG